MDSVKSSWESLTPEEREARYAAFGAKPRERIAEEKKDFNLLEAIENDTFTEKRTWPRQ